MRSPIVRKVRHLVIALIGGVFSLGVLLIMLNTPAIRDIALQAAGWGIAGGVLALGFQKRLLWPWRYALAAAVILAVLLQVSLLLQYSSTPVVRAANITVNSLDDDMIAGDGKCTLREAIINANQNSDQSGGDCLADGVVSDMIVFDPISAAGTIVLTQTNVLTDENQSATGDLDITESVQIVGLGTATTTIDADGIDRVFHILASSGTIEFSGLTIQGGNSDGDGGGVFNAGAATVVLDTVTIQNNQVVGLGEDGGGIANTGGGQVNMTNSIVANNAATNTITGTANGGGIFNTSNTGKLTIAQSTLSDNTTTGDGGGIYNQISGEVTLTDQTDITNNTATEYGGGIFNTANGNVTIDNVEILSNTTATRDGGGIANQSGTMMVSNSLISGNSSAATDGGGVANFGQGSTIIGSSAITGNDANDDGGGVFHDSTGTMAFDDTTISGNTAGDNGGGIFSPGSGTVTIDRSTISGNAADTNRGGGVFSSGPVNINVSTISGNTANAGGGIATNTQNAQVTLNGVTIAENTATSGNGGGILRDNATDGGGSIIFRNSLIASNIGADCTDLGGAPSPATLTSQGNNLIGNDTGCTGLVASDITDVNPLLGPLADNGHTTQTHALQLGSPAIDGGNTATCETTDQRNTSRINQPGVGSEANNSCDVGAYEFTNIVTVPSVQISDATITEGDSGTAVMTFTVSLIGVTPPFTATVDYATADDTATVANDDYIPVNDTLTFAPAGPSSQDITVFVKGDTTPEVDEFFNVNLSKLNWVTLSDGQGRGTIVNDDLSISISDTSVVEGDTGTVEMVFEVTLSPVQNATTIDVDYETADGDTPADGIATVADNDYVAESGLVTFSPGITKQQISITVNGDTTKENDEFFFVNLSNPTGGAGLVNGGSARGTIKTDDTDFPIFLPVVIKN